MPAKTRPTRQRVRRAAERSGPKLGRQVSSRCVLVADCQQPGEQLQERVEHHGIEVRAPAFPHEPKGFFQPEVSAVNARARQRVEDVRHREDETLDRDLPALEPLRVAGAVVSLVVGERDGCRRLEKLGVGASKNAVVEPCCSFIVLRSPLVSSPGFRRIASGTAIFPTSWSGAARRMSSHRSGGRPSCRASFEAYPLTRSMCLPVSGSRNPAACDRRRIISSCARCLESVAQLLRTPRDGLLE